MAPAYPSGQGGYPTASQGGRPPVAMQGGYDRYPAPDRRYPMGNDFRNQRVLEILLTFQFN